mgnify:FL=1|jgi:hypothetical protein
MPSVLEAPRRPPRLQCNGLRLLSRATRSNGLLLVALASFCVRVGAFMQLQGGGLAAGLGFVSMPGGFLPLSARNWGFKHVDTCGTSRSFIGGQSRPPAVRGRGAAGAISMSKKDQRYKLAKRGMNEDELLLTVAEQFNRREGKAQISWYPGHIAKAEKRLQEVKILSAAALLGQPLRKNMLVNSRFMTTFCIARQVLSAVDVVVEVRDARIPTATTHPMIDDWLKNRNAQRVVCMSKVDMAPRAAMSMWKAYLESTLSIPVAFMNCRYAFRARPDRVPACR